MAKILGMHQPAEIKNFVINGAFDFWQEKAGTTTTINTATTVGSSTNFSADMMAFASAGATTKNYSLVRSTDVPTSAQSGFKSTYSMLFTMLTGIPSLAASDYIYPHLNKLEGLDYAKVHGKTVTFGFWIKASIAGIYSFNLSNAAFDRSYVTTFVVNGANTWEFKSITVTLDTSGTWLFDTSTGLISSIATVAGSTFQTATLNQWQSGYFVAATTATNWQATSGATVRLSQISMVEGSLGLGYTGFQRAGKDIQQELANCQRYFCQSGFPTFTVPQNNNPASQVSLTYVPYNAGNTLSSFVTFPVEMRSLPLMTFYDRVSAVGKVAAASSGGTYAASGGNITDGNAAPAGVNLTTHGFAFGSGGIGSGGPGIIVCQYTADARL